jgi:hypothetical protein
VVERAFELARSGQCANKTDILRLLRQERYGSADLGALDGLSITRQLQALCRAARPKPR